MEIGEPHRGKTQSRGSPREHVRVQEALTDWLRGRSLSEMLRFPTGRGTATLRREQVPQKPFVSCDTGTNVMACCFPGQRSGLRATSCTGS